jgi:ribosome-associated protein
MLKHKAAPQPVSRTQRKQAAQRLQQLGERLVALPKEQAGKIPMPEELATAVAQAREMRKHGARRRQLQFIGVLMRELDCGPIEKALADLSRGDRREVYRFKQVERWRDALVAGDMAVMADICGQCPAVDADRLERLVAAVGAAKAAPSRRKAARSLFRYLKELVSKN